MLRLAPLLGFCLSAALLGCSEPSSTATLVSAPVSDTPPGTSIPASALESTPENTDAVAASGNFPRELSTQELLEAASAAMQSVESAHLVYESDDRGWRPGFPVRRHRRRLPGSRPFPVFHVNGFRPSLRVPQVRIHHDWDPGVPQRPGKRSVATRSLRSEPVCVFSPLTGIPLRGWPSTSNPVRSRVSP